MANVISGKDGTVKISSTAVANITSWRLVKGVTTTRFASNETSGYKATVSGVKSATGTIEFKLDTGAAMTILEGTAATLLLYVNATEYYSVPAILSNFEVQCDIDNGAPVSGTANFESNGTYTEPSWA